MPITHPKKWKKWKKNNKDPYGGCCVNVAREVMRLLDEREEFDASDLICEADTNIKAGGITGFMAGAVATMVAQCHSRGEEFRKSWNGDVGGATGQEDVKGVLNPAVLNIG
jgi:hypothetical protein